ncbi:MAG: NADH-quinone oxidoreductase subunit L, partial [Gloeobacteraceae cyanobacterium ES-bin-316]|nr:NADH-quinone oxidoreductase subunit L [Ferruginibacter sp.]
AVLSVAGGYIGVPEALGGKHELAQYLSPVVKTAAHHLEHSTEYILMGLSSGLVLVSILFAWFKFKNYKVEGEATGFGRILQHKWYVDEIYNAVIVQPLAALSVFFDRIIEKQGIDGLVNGVGKAVNYGSRQLRLIQSGQVGAYVLLMVIGMLALFIIQLFA